MNTCNQGPTRQLEFVGMRRLEPEGASLDSSTVLEQGDS